MKIHIVLFNGAVIAAFTDEEDARLFGIKKLCAAEKRCKVHITYITINQELKEYVK